MHRTKSIFTLNLKSVAPYLPFLIFSALFLLGVLVGNLTIGRFDGLINQTAETLSEFVSIRREYNFYTVLKSSVIFIFPIYLVIFLCGTSVIGCIASPLVLICKGFEYGCLSGYLCFTYRLEGIMFNAFLLIPYTLTSALGLVLLSKEAFSFSYLLSGICIKSNKPVNVYSNFKVYCTRSAITVVTALIAVLLDLGMSALFISFFDF